MDIVGAVLLNICYVYAFQHVVLGIHFAIDSNFKKIVGERGFEEFGVLLFPRCRYCFGIGDKSLLQWSQILAVRQRQSVHGGCRVVGSGILLRGRRQDGS